MREVGATQRSLIMTRLLALEAKLLRLTRTAVRVHERPACVGFGPNSPGTLRGSGDAAAARRVAPDQRPCL
jgi:hypothetical protein